MASILAFSLYWAQPNLEKPASCSITSDKKDIAVRAQRLSWLGTHAEGRSHLL
jgi:hypothetical protein